MVVQTLDRCHCHRSLPVIAYATGGIVAETVPPGDLLDQNKDQTIQRACRSTALGRTDLAPGPFRERVRARGQDCLWPQRCA
jgi:hypothetical protein